MKRLFALKEKNGLGRFAPSALPHYEKAFLPKGKKLPHYKDSPRSPSLRISSWVSSSSSSTVVVSNVRQGTGLVAAENAFSVREELKKRGATFLGEGCGQVMR